MQSSWPYWCVHLYLVRVLGRCVYMLPNLRDQGIQSCSGHGELKDCSTDLFWLLYRLRGREKHWYRNCDFN